MNEKHTLLEDHGVLHSGIAQLLKTTPSLGNKQYALEWLELLQREITATDGCQLITCLAPDDLPIAPGLYDLVKIGREFRAIPAKADGQSFPNWKPCIPQHPNKAEVPPHGCHLWQDAVQQVFSQHGLMISLTRFAKTFAAMDKLDVPWTIHYGRQDDPVMFTAEVDQIQVRVLLMPFTL